MVLRGDCARDDLMYVAPDPVFARLDRAHHRMAAVLKMFGGVLVLRRIAATHLPAGHAHAQVNPGVTDLDAVFTDVLLGRRDLDLVQMFAFFCHFRLPTMVRSITCQSLLVYQALSRSLRSQCARFAPAS